MYELHFDGQVLCGTLEDLRDFAESITPYWEIFEIKCSDLNKHKYQKLTVSDMREIVKLRSKKWTYTGIANRFDFSPSRMRLILMALSI